MVENCDITLKILHEHNPFERIRDPDNCDVRLIFCEVFSLVHVIITTIINVLTCNKYIKPQHLPGRDPCCPPGKHPGT